MISVSFHSDGASAHNHAHLPNDVSLSMNRRIAEEKNMYYPHYKFLFNLFVPSLILLFFFPFSSLFSSSALPAPMLMDVENNVGLEEMSSTVSCFKDMFESSRHLSISL